MVISYQGVESFKISQGDLTLALNPISKESKFKPTRFSADLTLITTDLPDFNGRDQTSRSGKESFLIDGPGEYEIKGIFIKGFPSVGPAEKINTIYTIAFEGVKLCFLGALGDSALSTETLEALENVDILFIPICGVGMLDPVSAYKLAVSLEPRAIIPMNYTKENLEQFIKEGGEARIESLDKFVIKKKDLEDKKGWIVVLRKE